MLKRFVAFIFVLAFYGTAFADGITTGKSGFYQGPWLFGKIVRISDGVIYFKERCAGPVMRVALGPKVNYFRHDSCGQPPQAIFEMCEIGGHCMQELPECRSETVHNVHFANGQVVSATRVSGDGENIVLDLIGGGRLTGPWSDVFLLSYSGPLGCLGIRGNPRLGWPNHFRFSR